MGVKVRIPTPLQKLTGNRPEVECKGSDINELLNDLERQCPGIKERLCGEKGELRRFVNLYVNEEDIRFLKGQETPLKDGDDVSIIPAIAGGGSASKKAKRRVTLVFPQELITEPVVFTMAKKFDIMPNIRKARVTETVGEMTLEL
ncbi:MAG: MoaD family protein, partial [Candidatus Omnitrophica bacterium]|nr:MoaD family protein [Candidatus Omnitrophota bacterium]